ncbi:twin-arginine translocation signal domain-containing protein [Thiothrix subterranea]|uniref:Twin-arginine translocation signal domain-containing protein n=1 Tax=Thiothrix subterranea TaxID=2735563 RepID=A0AA51MP01_9GAMM|nr:twin-arginine translocation signal domain-containing protein [Thiothrix subterranea]MDQ5770712.1 twin-arginine translocation signal domain-containing protein [Thiothrix subterranea]WML87730.1 twin-arginine translocation signal domain-containing protein [Thiothrix subterranea]
MKPTEQTATRHSRRDFLRGTLAAGTGAALAVTLPGVASAEPPAVIAPAEPQAKQGYRETAHIAAYYKTAAR